MNKKAISKISEDLQFDFSELAPKFTKDLKASIIKLSNGLQLSEKDIKIINAYFFMQANFEYAEELRDELQSHITNHTNNTKLFTHSDKTKSDEYFCFYVDLQENKNWVFDEIELEKQSFYLIDPGIKSKQRTSEKLSKTPSGQIGKGAAYDYNISFLSDITRAALICRDMMDLDMIYHALTVSGEIQYIEKDKLQDLSKIPPSGYRDRKLLIFSKNTYPVKEIDMDGNITVSQKHFKQELQLKLQDYDRVSVKEHKDFEKRRDTTIQKTPGDFIIEAGKTNVAQIDYSEATRNHNNHMQARLIFERIKEQNIFQGSEISKEEKDKIKKDSLEEFEKFGHPYLLNYKNTIDLSIIHQRENTVNTKKIQAKKVNTPWSDDVMQALLKRKDKLNRKTL